MRIDAAESGVLNMTKATLQTRLRDLLGTDQVKIDHGDPADP